MALPRPCLILTLALLICLVTGLHYDPQQGRLEMASLLLVLQALIRWDFKIRAGFYPEILQQSLQFRLERFIYLLVQGNF